MRITFNAFQGVSLGACILRPPPDQTDKLLTEANTISRFCQGLIKNYQYYFSNEPYDSSMEISQSISNSSSKKKTITYAPSTLVRSIGRNTINIQNQQ